MYSLLIKKTGICVLLFAVFFFCVQTYFVYSDATGYELLELSPIASKGREVWHKYNCQSCHQIYGFGGFLGPDLTNRGKIYTTNILRSLLAAGPRGMPSTYLTKQEALSLYSYFNELDMTGKSQPISKDVIRISELPWFTYIKFQNI